MRNLHIYLPVFLLLLFSCKKDVIDTEPLPIEECPECKESFVDDFSDYEASIHVCITGHAYCGISSIYQHFYFRMEPYTEIDGKFFYQTKKRNVYQYFSGSHEIDWTHTEGYYRYDYDAKIAYQYSTLEDSDPLVLMDFNHSSGDSILIDDDSDIGPVYAVVTDITDFLIEGVPYPMMTVNLVSDLSKSTPCILTPYYPNPIIFDNPFGFYFWHDWDESNLGNYYTYVQTYAEYFDFKLNEISTGEAVSAVGLVNY